MRSASGVDPASLADGARRVALGLASIGLYGLLAFVVSLRSSLYGIRADDPATFALGVGVLGVVTVIASAIPAVRAARLDPMVVLREE